MIQNWNIATVTAPTACINPRGHDTFETQPISSRPNTIYNPNEGEIVSFRQRNICFGEFSANIKYPFSHVHLQWNLRSIITIMTDFILSNKTFDREAYEIDRRKEREREKAKVERANIMSSISLMSNVDWNKKPNSDPLHQNGFTSLKRSRPATPRARSFLLTPPATPEPQEDSSKPRGGGSVISKPHRC